jgi:hypothetical protein
MASKKELPTPEETIKQIIHELDTLVDERIKVIHEIYGKSYIGRDGPMIEAAMDPDGELGQLYDLRKKADGYLTQLLLKKPKK